MRFEVTELCAALGARSVGPPVAVVDGLATDSRAVVEGQLFAAVRAERDGHDFVAGAVASGAGISQMPSPSSGLQTGEGHRLKRPRATTRTA